MGKLIFPCRFIPGGYSLSVYTQGNYFSIFLSVFYISLWVCALSGNFRFPVVKCSKMKPYIFFLFVQGFTTSSKPVRNRGDISEKLWTARRKTETMLNTCLNQKISWINEEKRKKQYKQILDSSKDVAHWRFI